MMEDINSKINQFKRIKRKINFYIKKKVKILESFFVKENSSFIHCHTPHPNEKKISLSSTSTCIISLHNTNDLNNLEEFDSKTLLNGINNLEEWTSAKLEDRNYYTISILLPGLKVLNGKKTEIQEELNKIKKELETKGAVQIMDYPPNSFVTYWCLKSLREWDEFDLEKLKTSKEWFLQNFFKQITYHYTKEYDKFNYYELGYSLNSLYEFFYEEVKEIISQNVICKALTIIFKYQRPFGRWDKGNEIFHYPGIGAAYCHDFEMIRSLMRSFNKKKDPYSNEYELFYQFIEQINNSINWIDLNYVQQPNMGWNSGHNAQVRTPESWATATVLDFLYEYEKIYNNYMKSLIIKDLNLKNEISKKPTNNVKNSLLELSDSKIYYMSDYLNLIQDILHPKIIEKDTIEDRACGIIFCGPPGTGKTTLAKNIARDISWDYIEIPSGKFIEKNFWNIGESAQDIFEKLLLLEKSVILFDEFDELVKQRNDGGEIINRFLTTTMLPYFQKLYDKKNVIFIIATNHIGSFDSAITRIGRFDFILNVNQPSNTEIVKQFIKTMVEDRKENLVKDYFLPILKKELYSLIEYSSKLQIIENYFKEFDDYVRQEIEIRDKKTKSKSFSSDQSETPDESATPGDDKTQDQRRLKKKVKEILKKDGHLKDLYDEIRNNNNDYKELIQAKNLGCEDKERAEKVMKNNNRLKEKVNISNLYSIISRFTFKEIKPFIRNQFYPLFEENKPTSNQIKKKFTEYCKDLTISTLLLESVQLHILDWITKNKINK